MNTIKVGRRILFVAVIPFLLLGCNGEMHTTDKEHAPENCRDSRDNDGDNQIDCDDSDCFEQCASDGGVDSTTGFDSATPFDACTNPADCEKCIPSCEGRTCGDDGCEGSCGQCDSPLQCGETGTCECINSCPEEQVCGVSPCGESCGECPEGFSCNADQTACDCVNGEQEYTLDASGIDWSVIRFVGLTTQQHYPDGTVSGTQSIFLHSAVPVNTLRFTSCIPDLEFVQRIYVFESHDVSSCDVMPGERVDWNHVVIPMPPDVGPECGAGSLTMP